MHRIDEDSAQPREVGGGTRSVALPSRGVPLDQLLPSFVRAPGVPRRDDLDAGAIVYQRLHLGGEPEGPVGVPADIERAHTGVVADRDPATTLLFQAHPRELAIECRRRIVSQRTPRGSEDGAIRCRQLPAEVFTQFGVVEDLGVRYPGKAVRLEWLRAAGWIHDRQTAVPEPTTWAGDGATAVRTTVCQT